ncbi:MAG: helix-turn-helix domain-containing protein [Lachnospiraceae bacterium]|nr:helix-turn-helix domain-containing protein [Lachnospiraceae bacterium]
MEKLIERGLLFDYYGGLLSEKNKRIYEACAVDDMSLAEIADEMGISRQAVSETLKRIDMKLQGYERELRLIQRTDSIEKYIGEIREAISEDDIDRTRIEDILSRIDEAL